MLGLEIRKVLEMKGIIKEFFGVRVLDRVDLDVCAGEIHGLVGENGAGKSTLIKILCGYHSKDAGQILLDGEPVNIRGQEQACEIGIACVHQEVSVVPFMSVADNVFLAQEPQTKRLRFLIAERELESKAAEILACLGAKLDVRMPAKILSVAQQQVVMICRALVRNPRVLILDEPTASLSPHEVESLFAVVRSVARMGVSVIYISHRLGEIQKITDRVTVLRDGKNVGTVNTSEVTADDIAKLIVGRGIQRFPMRHSCSDRPVLVVSHLTRGNSVRDVSFSVHAGEIVGVVGLVGAGKTELLRLVFGADRSDSGSVHIDGEDARIRNPRDAIRCGLGLIPEDRRGQGLISAMNVRENASLVALKNWRERGILRLRKERMSIQQMVQDLSVVCTGTEQKVRFLSGGNQQKVVVGKWLLGFGRCYMFDEATQGVDIGAKTEIYRLIQRIADNGAGCIFATSDIGEALGLCHRVLVMHGGRIAMECDPSQVTEDQVLSWAAGGGRTNGSNI